MKKRLPKKLQLAKETVRALGDRELSQAAAGSLAACQFTTFIYDCTDPSICAGC